VTNLRVFLFGGFLSYRALFGWTNPWVFFPILVVAPIFQLLFFAFLGRAAGLEDDPARPDARRRRGLAGHARAPGRTRHRRRRNARGQRGLILGELAIGFAYTAVGFALLRYFEAEARRHATLERS